VFFGKKSFFFHWGILGVYCKNDENANSANFPNLGIYGGRYQDHQNLVFSGPPKNAHFRDHLKKGRFLAVLKNGHFFGPQKRRFLGPAK
jgi:hypothetical protein